MPWNFNPWGQPNYPQQGYYPPPVYPYPSTDNTPGRDDYVKFLKKELKAAKEVKKAEAEKKDGKKPDEKKKEDDVKLSPFQAATLMTMFSLPLAAAQIYLFSWALASSWDRLHVIFK